LKTEVTEKNWLSTSEFQHKSNPNNALNLFKVLQYDLGIQRCPSHGFSNEADI